VSAEERGEAVLAVLRRAGRASDDARVSRMSQLEGGWSRHSYLVAVAEPSQADREFIVRARPDATPLDTDVEQEYRVYELLADSPVPIPRAYGIELGDTPFGGPFFVMDCVPGKAPNIWRRNDREGIERDWDEGRRIAEDFVQNLVAIHSVDPEVAAASVAPVSFQDIVGRWRGIQEEMQVVRDPVADATYDWVASREPDRVPPRLVHGDYRIGNCLIHEGRISGVRASTSPTPRSAGTRAHSCSRRRTSSAASRSPTGSTPATPS
jgi:aminoglycoside phosphotransferase (APT) family kinase protein